MKTVEEIFALAIALPDDDVKRLFSLLGAFIFSSDMSESETKSGSDLACVEESQAVAEANGSADDCVRDSAPVEGKPSDLKRVSANTADESTDTFSDAESVAEKLVRPGNRANLEKTTIKARFKDGRVCPFCGSNKLVRNGHRPDGVQKYHCKDCGKNSSITSNSALAGTKKGFDVWKRFMECMLHGMSLRKTAKACDIHYNTAFLWRHKILDALQIKDDGVTLAGTVQQDELFFPISYKGNHSKSKMFTMPRNAHHRGKEVHVKGLSKEQACVPCGLDKTGAVISKITNTGNPNAMAIDSLFGGRIEEGSTCVTDKSKAYPEYARKNNLNLVQLRDKESRAGEFNIQAVNSYHSGIRRFLRHFNGVATKYLNNYLTWNNRLMRGHEDDDVKAEIGMRVTLAMFSRTTRRNMPKRAPVPVLA